MKNATFSLLATVIISEMKGGKRVEVGTVSIPYPSLADLEIPAPEGIQREDGSIDYGNNEHNWLANAIQTAVVNKGKNMLAPKSVEFRSAGSKFATTMAEVAAPFSGGGNPEALKAIAAVKASFAEYLIAAQISAQAQTRLKSLFGSAKAIETQNEAVKDKVAARIEAYADWATENDPEAVNSEYAVRYMESLLAACSADELDLDDL